MIKLLIVDDEPLVQVGIKSMLNWSELNIEICGTAFNGKQALTMIKDHEPDIVLSDIKMPVMNGIELLKVVREKNEELPIFIFLTSYDDFSLVKEAIKYQALDYLLKLEISPDSLKQTVKKAIKQLNKLQHLNPSSLTKGVEQFYDQFMIRLINGLFNSRKEFLSLAKELNITFDGLSYSLCLCTITDFINADLSQDKLISLYFSAMQMMNNLMKKFTSCQFVTLDTKRFCIIIAHNSKDEKAINIHTNKALMSTLDMINKYFSINLYVSISKIYDDPLALCNAYKDTRQIQSLCNPDNPIIFYSDLSDDAIDTHNTFHLGLFKNEIRLAFESYDINSFQETISRLIELFNPHPHMLLQAIDASSNLLYMTLSLLPNSSGLLDKAFSDNPQGYRSIYIFTRMEQVIAWLINYADCITDLLQTKHKSFKNHMIQNIQDYIDLHIYDKITLNDIATNFNISNNYLSVLFKKTVGVGFNEYITTKKIAIAKAKLLEDDVFVYELAEELGFENAFYFSKVFKKVVGCSPSNYIKEQKE